MDMSVVQTILLSFISCQNRKSCYHFVKLNFIELMKQKLGKCGIFSNWPSTCIRNSNHINEILYRRYPCLEKNRII